MENERITPYPLRMPPELREELELSAKEHKRSLNAEIVLRLNGSISSEKMQEPDFLANSKKKDAILKIAAEQLSKPENREDLQKLLKFILTVSTL